MITKMKHAALTLGLLILLVVPAGAKNSTDDPENDRASSGPELVVAEPLFEFERVLDDESVEHDFLIANRGAGPLAIHQVRTG